MTSTESEDVMRQFERGLATVKFEFQKNLQEIDPLDSDALKNMLKLFNQRLVIFQHDFLDYLAKVRGGVNLHTEDFQFESIPVSRIPEIAASILAGSGGAILVAIIPVAQTGWWLWATTVTAAGAIGGAVGVPAGVATAGVGILLGIGGGVVTVICLKSYRRRLIRQALEKKFDDDVAPSLRAWAKGKINAN